MVGLKGSYQLYEVQLATSCYGILQERGLPLSSKMLATQLL